MLATLIPAIGLLTGLYAKTDLPIPQSEEVLSEHQISLDDRYAEKSVNQVFKDNILLNLAYLEGKVPDPKNINWGEVEKPFHYEFKLDPNQTFAFQKDVLPQYQGKVSKTTDIHFNGLEGFKTDGYLFGDGVCHLASLLYWAAKDANLSALAPTNHDFMPIPEIPKEYGVAIYSSPGLTSTNEQENLYITNNKDKAITFKFDYSDNNLQVSVVQD